MWCDLIFTLWPKLNEKNKQFYQKIYFIISAIQPLVTHLKAQIGDNIVPESDTNLAFNDLSLNLATQG